MNNKLTTIYILRHGESEGNVGIKSEILHELGTNLTEKGIEQAKKVAEKLKDIHFDAIFSSDLRRTKQTADIIALDRKIQVNITNLIRERSLRSYAKEINAGVETLRKEIESNLIKLDELRKMKYKHSPLMESAEERALRLFNYIKKLSVSHSEKTILICAHGNLMRSFLTHIGFAKFDELPNGSIENTGYFVLETNGKDFFVKETKNVNKQKNKIRDF